MSFLFFKRANVFLIQNYTRDPSDLFVANNWKSSSINIPLGLNIKYCV